MNFQFKKREWTIVILLLIMSIAFIGLFFYDLSVHKDISDREKIGVVEFKNNIVQRKFDGYTVWESIKKNSLITNRDTIRSDSSSDAVIRLDNGTVISMDENSMFYLDISDKDPSLDLTKGNINIKKTTNSKNTLHIKSNNTSISIQDGELNLNKKQDGSFSIFVERGEASIAQTGETQKIESGKFAEIESESLTIKKSVFQLTSPTNTSIITSKSDSEVVDFQWKPLQTVTDIKLQLAKTTSFDEVVHVVNSPGQSEKFPLPVGTYYWRVTSKEGNSPVYKVQIYRESNVSSKLPTDNVILSYVEKLPTIFFQWNEDPLAKEYVLEIAGDKKFDKLASNHTTKTNSIAVDNLSQGEYFWRVKSTPLNQSLPTKMTQPKTFRIQQTTEFNPPTLTRPLNVSLSEEEFSRSGFFAWEGNSEFNEYEFKLSSVKDFSKEILTSKVNQNIFKLESNLAPGEYFWKVRGFSSTGKASNYSQSGRFEIVKGLLDSSQVNSEEFDSNKDKVKSSIIITPKNTSIDLSGKSSILFNWSRFKSPNEDYRITLFIEEKNSKKPIFQEKSRITSYEFKNLMGLNEGKYIWELSVLDSGRIIYKESSNITITLTKLKTLNSTDIEFISPRVLYKN